MSAEFSSTEDLLREELAAARQCLPTTAAIEKLLNRVLPETDPVPDSEALDVVEEVMEFQEALEGVRDALQTMHDLLNPSESNSEAARVTVHILEAGVPLCGFTPFPPRDWPADQKWCHTVNEWLNLLPHEESCAKCIKFIEKRANKPLRRCATCKKPFPPEYVGHNVTYDVWYCTPECYRAAGGVWP